MTLDDMITQRRNLVSQIQALDILINSHLDAPWAAMAADYIHTNQPAMASQVHRHTYELCSQADLPAPTVKQLLHGLTARGFRRTRKATGIYWSTPAS